MASPQCLFRKHRENRYVTSEGHETTQQPPRNLTASPHPKSFRSCIGPTVTWLLTFNIPRSTFTHCPEPEPGGKPPSATTTKAEDRTLETSVQVQHSSIQASRAAPTTSSIPLLQHVFLCPHPPDSRRNPAVTSLVFDATGQRDG